MSETASPKIVILGAGAIGCWVGGTWAAAGLDIALIGRERVKAEVAAHGLHLTDFAGLDARVPAERVPFPPKAKTLGAADIIVLCVKSIGTDEAAKEIARFGRKGAAVISFQNGVSNADKLREALPGFQVLQGMVPFNVAHLGQGRWHKGTSGELFLEDHPVSRDLAERIGNAPGQLRLAPDMKSVAWGKLIINLNNAVNALSGKRLLEQLSERDYRRVVAASQLEALDALKRAGITPAQLGPLSPSMIPHAVGAPDWIFKRLVLKVQKIDPNARSSMADDFAAGRPSEIDYLNGEVVKLAKAQGRRAPVNEAIVALVRQAEAGVERAWSGADLWAHVRKHYRPKPGLGY